MVAVVHRDAGVDTVSKAWESVRDAIKEKNFRQVDCIVVQKRGTT